MGARALDLAQRERVDPASVHPLLRGRFVRPRAITVDQNPSKVLDANPNRLGAWIFNNGGKLELPVALPGAPAGTGSALALATFLDSAGIQVPGYAASTFKSLYLIVDVALAWTNAAQATLQLIVGREPWSPASGAASGAGGTTNNFLKGAAASLGGAGATSLAQGVFPFSPADIADLQWHHPYIGAELKFGSALTAGAARLFLELAGGPTLCLGEDSQIDGSRSGDRAGTFVLPAQASPMWIAADGELFAVASPGGVVDCRVWEVLVVAPQPGAPSY